MGTGNAGVPQLSQGCRTHIWVIGWRSDDGFVTKWIWCIYGLGIAMDLGDLQLLQIPVELGSWVWIKGLVSGS